MPTVMRMAIITAQASVLVISQWIFKRVKPINGLTLLCYQALSGIGIIPQEVPLKLYKQTGTLF